MTTNQAPDISRRSFLVSAALTAAAALREIV